MSELLYPYWSEKRDISLLTNELEILNDLAFRSICLPSSDQKEEKVHQ